MKRTSRCIAAALAMLILCASLLTGCSEHNITGSWKLSGCITIDGVTLSAEELGDMELKIKENGEVVIVTNQTEQVALWSYEEELLIIDSMISKFDGKTITIPIADIGTLTFTRN